MFAIDITIYQVILDFMLIIFLVCLNEIIISKRKPSVFFYMLLSDLMMLITRILGLMYQEKLHENPDNGKAYTIFVIITILNFIFYYATTVFFVYYQISYIRKDKNISYLPAHINLGISVVSCIVWIISVFTKTFFTVENGIFIFSKNHYYGEIGGLISFIISIYILIKNRKMMNILDKTAFYSVIIPPVLIVFLREHAHHFTIQICFSFSIMILFNFAHIGMIRRLSKERFELTEKQVKLTLSQIQPHFIFNILNSIYVLCDKDPLLAKQTLGSFSKYLRANLQVSQINQLVLFDMEMEHTKNYIELEKIRFDEELNVEYNLVDRNFKLPPLTIQPIVENAVKHGICKKKGGGTIKIESYMDGDLHVIKISDDGVGFDTKTLKCFAENYEVLPEEEMIKRQVGLRIVRDRLWKLCRGELKITSKIGEGTTVFIMIPSEEKGGVIYDHLRMR
ncbi:MAG: histidine kinase [Treponemataceae bacterium]|nr:histidine kinase [Treponemataceae bacterium]